MADKLAAPEDLASLLERDLDRYKAEMVIECGTAVVQEAAGNQRLVQVVDDPGTIMGTTDSWLDLPQRPVTAVSDVTIDGVAIAAGRSGYLHIGNRLWRACGWATYWGEPSIIGYVSTHGYVTGSQDLQLARNAVLGLVRGLFDNESGALRVAIDDYSAAYDAMSASMDASPNLRAALQRKYGQRAGVVRLG